MVQHLHLCVHTSSSGAARRASRRRRYACVSSCGTVRSGRCALTGSTTSSVQLQKSTQGASRHHSSRQKRCRSLSPGHRPSFSTNAVLSQGARAIRAGCAVEGRRAGLIKLGVTQAATELRVRRAACGPSPAPPDPPVNRVLYADLAPAPPHTP